MFLNVLGIMMLSFLCLTMMPESRLLPFAKQQEQLYNIVIVYLTWGCLYALVSISYRYAYPVDWLELAEWAFNVTLFTSSWNNFIILLLSGRLNAAYMSLSTFFNNMLTHHIETTATSWPSSLLSLINSRNFLIILWLSIQLEVAHKSLWAFLNIIIIR